MITTSQTREQGGFSLVGIMIGLLLAMITVLASLTLYRTLAHTSVDSRIDAALDGQIASAMLTLQLEIQSAGFGYPTSIEHVVKNSESIYWRYKDSVDVCRAFRVAKIGNDNTNLQLQLLKPSSCDSTSYLPTLSGWDVLSVLADIKVRSGDKLPNVRLTLLSDVECFPYGMSTIDWKPQQLVIEIDNAARRAALDDTTLTAPNAPLTYTFCLSNTGGGISIP